MLQVCWITAGVLDYDDDDEEEEEEEEQRRMLAKPKVRPIVPTKGHDDGDDEDEEDELLLHPRSNQ